MRRVLLTAAVAVLLVLAFAAGRVWQQYRSVFLRGNSDMVRPQGPIQICLQQPDKQAQAAAIQRLLTQQAADWNRGDLDAFAAGYKNSPDILFIGRKVSHGYDQMLASYKQGYASREKMGTLTFSELEVQPLDPQFATATGHYHLERTAAAGGNADGFFLLVLEDTASGWKIVRDDTTALTPPPRS